MYTERGRADTSHHSTHVLSQHHGVGGAQHSSLLSLGDGGPPPPHTRGRPFPHACGGPSFHKHTRGGGGAISPFTHGAWRTLPFLPSHTHTGGGAVPFSHTHAHCLADCSGVCEKWRRSVSARPVVSAPGIRCRPHPMRRVSVPVEAVSAEL